MESILLLSECSHEHVPLVKWFDLSSFEQLLASTEVQLRLISIFPPDEQGMSKGCWPAGLNLILVSQLAGWT